MTKEEISKAIEACEKELAELRQKMDEPEYGGKRWKPHAYETYYYVCADGDYGTDIASPFHPCDKPNRFQAFGNVFRTKEEAEFAAERIRVITELSDFAEADDAVWDGEQYHFQLYYNHSTEGIGCDFGRVHKFGDLYFPSKEAALAAVEAVGAERVKKYYLRVKE